MTSLERVKAICKDRKIPISRLERELGYANGYIGQLRKGVFPDDRLVEIAKFLGVATDFLLTGQENEKAPALTSKDKRDIEQKLADVLTELENGQDGLMFSGEALDDTTRELLAASLRNSMEMGKKLAKQKFTPKKYRKGD